MDTMDIVVRELKKAVSEGRSVVEVVKALKQRYGENAINFKGGGTIEVIEDAGPSGIEGIVRGFPFSHEVPPVVDGEVSPPAEWEFPDIESGMIRDLLIWG